MILGRLLKVGEIAETAAATFLYPLFLLFVYFLAALITLFILSIVAIFVKLPGINVLMFNLIVSVVATIIAADFFRTAALGKNILYIIFEYFISAVLIGIVYIIFAVPAYAAFGKTLYVPNIIELSKVAFKYFIEGLIYGLEWGLVPMIYMIALAFRR